MTDMEAALAAFGIVVFVWILLLSVLMEKDQ